jgi:hypothetical protein
MSIIICRSSTTKDDKSKSQKMEIKHALGYTLSIDSNKVINGKSSEKKGLSTTDTDINIKHLTSKLIKEASKKNTVREFAEVIQTNRKPLENHEKSTFFIDLHDGNRDDEIRESDIDVHIVNNKDENGEDKPL